jgi:xanthine dehydrogenase molybdenum-binding subunit
LKVSRLLVEGETPPLLDREFSVIGRDVDRVDALEKVTGNAVYAGDMALPNMLYAKCLRSPHAHARIKRIDVSKAVGLPGVKGIIYKDNCPGWNTYWYMIPQPAFPEMVSYAGQEVAVVAADDIDTAEKACELISVEYERLPHLLDAEEASKSNAVFVDPLDLPDPTSRRAPQLPPVGNIYNGKPEIMRRGNVEKGLADADVIVEGTYSTGFQYHATLQTRCAIADWNDKTLTVYESGQGVWNEKRNLAKSLGLPLEQIRVVTKYMGGGFGSKAGAQRFIHYAAKLAIITKRPVRLEFTRPEEFVNHPHRFAAKMWLKVGAKSNGMLTAVVGKGLINIGAGSTFGNQGKKFLVQPFELYECLNAYLECCGIYTNAQLTGYMRSVMQVISNFFLESHMERVAAELKIDPLELRFRNYTLWGDQEKKIPYSTKNLDRCMRIVADNIGWQRRTKLTEDNKRSSIKRGIGMASYIYGGTGAEPFEANADVLIKTDGTVSLLAGVVDIGGGQATILKMIAAEELGVTLGRVSIEYGDTEQTKYSPGSHASRITAEMGPAVLQAAAEARRRIFHVASKILEANAADLCSKNDVIYVKEDPSRQVDFDGVCRALGSAGEVKGSGKRARNPSDVVLRTFGAQAAEVRVDVETGAVKVVKVVSAHELGRALNPKLCFSQHYGGIIMGLGFALLEEPVFDAKTGLMLNPDLHQYRTPTSFELPEIIPFNVEAEDPFFAYSAKALAEATMVATPAAIRNAIYHATGIALDSLPMTRDRILEALYRS